MTDRFLHRLIQALTWLWIAVLAVGAGALIAMLYGR